MKIAFVCLGNICRSPIAKFVMRHLVEEAGYSDRVFIDSFGTSNFEVGGSIHHGSANVLIKNEIPFSTHVAKQLTKENAKDFDYLIAMDEHNFQEIQRIIGLENPAKVRKLNEKPVEDPYYTGGFDLVYREIASGCVNLLEEITPQLAENHPNT